MHAPSRTWLEPERIPLILLLLVWIAMRTNEDTEKERFSMITFKPTETIHLKMQSHSTWMNLHSEFRDFFVEKLEISPSKDFQKRDEDESAWFKHSRMDSWDAIVMNRRASTRRRVEPANGSQWYLSTSTVLTSPESSPCQITNMARSRRLFRFWNSPIAYGSSMLSLVESLWKLLSSRLVLTKDRYDWS